MRIDEKKKIWCWIAQKQVRNTLITPNGSNDLRHGQLDYGEDVYVIAAYRLAVV